MMYQYPTWEETKTKLILIFRQERHSKQQQQPTNQHRLSFDKFSFMRKTLIMLLFSFTLCDYTYGQIDIFLSDYKEYITPRKCNDSITHYLKDSSFLNLKLANCKGKMSIKQYDRNGNLLLAGQYVASLDTLKEYVDVFNLVGEITAIKVYKYFQPLRDGIWVFYEMNEIKKKEKYKRGILIKE